MNRDALRPAVLIPGVLLATASAVAVPPVERDEPVVAAADASALPGPTTYKVVEGSYLVDDCRCGKPAIMIPVQGSFTLVPGGVDPLFEHFTIRGLLLGGGVAGISYQVTGAGTYRRGGEVAIVEEMTLAVTVGDRAGVTLGSGLVAPQAAAPWIEIDLVEMPSERVQFYALHLVATPWPEVWFSTGQPFTPLGQPRRPGIESRANHPTQHRAGREARRHAHGARPRSRRRCPAGPGCGGRHGGARGVVLAPRPGVLRDARPARRRRRAVGPWRRRASARRPAQAVLPATAGSGPRP
jgi:hypothetical protein